VFILWAMLFGSLVGWIGSLIMRTDTSEGILLDMAAGLLGAIPFAALLGNGSTFDSLLAGGIGAMIAVSLLKLVRLRLQGP
jgi:uncharacterized membrane protein YeaQ/YmgE (transglycosylase-associated protein family)